MINRFRTLNSSIVKKPQLLLLSSLFSCALLMHFGMMWKSPKTTVLLYFLVICQLVNHRRWWLTLIAIVFSLKTFLFDFPRQPNHANLETFISIFIISFLFIMIGKNKFNINNNSIAIFFRGLLICIYFWAGFHKLNSGFFNLNGGCSADICNKVCSLFTNGFVYNEYLQRFLQIVTIVIEMIIPFGLLFYSLRKTSLILLILFHFILNLSNFSNFSSLAGFLIVGSVLDLEGDFNKIFESLKKYQLISLLAVTVSYITFLYKPYLQLENTYIYKNLIYSIGWILFFTSYINNMRFNKVSNRISLIQVSLLFLISLWALQPYIGLSNCGTLTMFSNLVTEKSRNNHYLINTQKSKIWDFEENYVTILNVPEKYSYLEGYDLPITEFQVLVSDWINNNNNNNDNTPLECTILFKGSIINIADIRKSKLCKPQWWYRYIYYRRIPKVGVNECIW